MQQYNDTLKAYLNGDGGFSQEGFKRVPTCFAIMYGWVWDTEITREGVIEKIDTMRENGIRAFYILPEPAEFRPNSMVTRLNPPYLSQEYFELVRCAIEYAEQNDMYCWLYDEGGWPSGSACGRVKADWYSREQTNVFIESTHLPYANALKGCHPGLMFTDEPCRYGGARTGEEAAEMFCASLRQIADFCHAHGWLSGGHLDKDNTSYGGRTHGYGSALRCLQALDVPGVDVIGWQIGSALPPEPEWDGDMPFFPRMASSAASQSGHALSLTETFGVYGNCVSPDEMRWICGAQIVRGINLLNFLTMPYDGRDWFPMHERMLFSENMPGFGHLHAVTAELERAAYFMAHGRPTTDIALLFPQTEIWQDDADSKVVVSEFCRLGSMLEKQGIDFDIVDEATLRRGRLENGSVKVGLAVYHKIIAAEGAALTAETRKILDKTDGQSAQVVHTGETELWYKARRDAAGRLFVCVFNHAARAVTSKIHIDTELPLYQMDARTGDAYWFENGADITLQSGELLLLLASSEPIQTARVYSTVGMTEAAAVGMRSTARLKLDDKGARMVKCAEPIRPMVKFADAYGEAFSGEVEYIYTFNAGRAGKVRLSVCGVEDSALVRLNGQTVGYFTAKPYTLIADAVEGENTAALTVANPAANAYAHIDAEKWFTPAQIGPYHKKCLQFEKQSCRGGLTGPFKVEFLE